MKKICLVSLVSLLTYILAINTNADTPTIKLAVVDMQVILREAPQIAKINKKLTNEFQGRQHDIEKEQDNLKNETATLEKDSAVMKPDDRAKLQKKVMVDSNNVHTMMASFQKDLAQQQSNSLHAFSDQLNRIVSQLATQSGYDVVLQKGSTLYAKNDLDITQQVLQVLKKQ